MILITGGTGFIGKHLINFLIKENQNIRVLLRNKAQIDRFKGLPLEFFYGDLREPSSLKGIMKGVDIVFHLASVINAEREVKDIYWDVNVSGTRNLLNAAVKGKGELKRFVFCSTVGVMGPLESLPANEETTCNPINLYEKSKEEAERIVKEFHEKEGLPVVIIRPSWVYGPGDTRTLKLFQAINKKRFIIIGDGKTLIHPVYVEDLVTALFVSAFKKEAVGKTYIIAGERALPLHTLVNIIGENLNVPIPEFRLPIFIAKTVSIAFEIIYKPFLKRPPLLRRRLDFFIKDQSFDITKAKNEIGYQPQFNIREGIKKTIQWYRDNSYL